jgi:subtilisin family serine protease
VGARRLAIVGLTLLAAWLAAAAPASAGTCPAGGSYGTGGAPGSGAANDPLFAKQWGLTQIKAPAAWSRAALGGGATIAVLDTGADLSHPDLQGHLAPGADLQDPSDNGCPGPQDENGHGTHVSGIAAAVTYNGIGVAGTAPDAQIMPIRVLNAAGEGDIETVAQGIRVAADRGAKVINLSLGDLPVIGQTPALNQEIEEAGAYAWSRGAIIVAAAGNESVPLCSYPGATKNAICVGATDKQGLPSYYSNFPSDNDAVGVRAPGGTVNNCENDMDIWSTIWPGSGDDCDGIKGYETLVGTSMSAPFVSGLAAILSSGGLTNQQILDCIRVTSSNHGSFNPVYGYGIVDADAATASCGGTWNGVTYGSLATAGAGGGDRTAPVVRLRLARTTLRRLIATGRLRVRAAVNEAASLTMRAYTNRKTRRRSAQRRALTLASRSLRMSSSGAKTVTLKLGRKARRSLRGRRSAVITVASFARDTAGNTSTTSARRKYRR